jgi:hypothetical protein
MQNRGWLEGWNTWFLPVTRRGEALVLKRYYSVTSTACDAHEIHMVMFNLLLANYTLSGWLCGSALLVAVVLDMPNQVDRINEALPAIWTALQLPSRPCSRNACRGLMSTLYMLDQRRNGVECCTTLRAPLSTCGATLQYQRQR